jgi:hypothetical protein
MDHLRRGSASRAGPRRPVSADRTHIPALRRKGRQTHAISGAAGHVRALSGLLLAGGSLGLMVGCSSSSRPSAAVQTTAQAEAHPCGLLTAAEARSILGSAVRPARQAPLGPTCIFASTAGSVLATLSIQTGSIAQVQSRVRNLARATAAGHTTYCGTFGQPTLWVALNATRMLVVAAPCPTAEALATKVLPRIG